MELQVAVAVWVWPVVTGIRGEKGGEWAVEGRESVFVCVCGCRDGTKVWGWRWPTRRFGRRNSGELLESGQIRKPLMAR